MNDTDGGYSRLLENRLDGIDKRLDGHEDKIEGLQAWRSWITGMAVAVGMMFGAFGKSVLEFFRHT